MKACIVGVGAIGGLIGARIGAVDGVELGAVARGATLSALRRDGLQLRSDSETIRTDVNAVERAAELGPQDVVVIAVKAHALQSIAAEIEPLLGPDTVVVPAMNGIPWWFCQGDARFGRPLDSTDPGGRLAAAIPPSRVLGCVVHASASTPSPGVVRRGRGNGLVLGEAAGGESDRAGRVVDLLAAAGFDATQSADIRRDIWYKLWGNLTMNPVSAITGATTDRILADELVRAFCSEVMDEAAAIGEAIRCGIREAPEARHAVTARLGAFKTSMLQDVEANRPLEIDAIIASTREIGSRLGIASPRLDALLGLTRLFGRTRGLYA